MIKSRAGRLALLFTSMLALLAVTAGVANATEAAEAEATFADKMTFIGDSVTAGFGYCGPSESAKNVDCKPNQEMANSWNLGKNSLNDCKPPKGTPNDACSNNNFDGKPWHSEAWQAGPNAPDVAYPFQIAARQSGPEKAEVFDWALTGSTPADWDPDGGGAFGSLLGKLKDQYVGMTLGANPLLAYYTNIDISIPFMDVDGPCVNSTGYSGGPYSFTWYAGPILNQVACLKEHWNKLHQTQHLVRIYTQLLEQNDRVVVMGYYRACSWSFGNWQPKANPFKGPASGNDCKGEKRRISKDDPTKVSQWDQAVAVGAELNNLIHDAVMKAKDQARKEWPGTNRDDNLVYAQPDEAEWEQHQPLSGDGSWVFLRDTWIHPSKAGAANLADTVTEAMCRHFDHWCGEDTAWN